MPSSITANLNSPYLTLWQVSVPINAVGNPLNVSNNAATVGTHLFSTGDIIYTCNRFTNSATNGGIGFFQWYAIRVSSTQLAFAASFADASNNIRSTTALANSDSSVDSSTGMSICNVPVLFSRGNFAALDRITDSSLWTSSSKSAQSFQSADRVQIDLSIPNIMDSAGITNLVPCYNSFGLIGNNYSCGIMPAGAIFAGDSISGMSSTGITTNVTNWTRDYRILVQDKRIYIQNRQTNNSYLTIFTSLELPLNVTDLRLFANFSLNGRALTNCQITYL